MRSTIYSVAIFAWILTAAVAHAAEQTVTLARMTVVVWSSDTRATGRQPVIIFSHGFHGCATQTRFLMRAFASAGYIVFAPDHADATCKGGKSTWRDRPEIPFLHPNEWSDATYRERADDIRHLIEAIATDQRFRDRADLSRLGLAGHSLGGYTALGLAGAWPTWKLDGIKAVLALSPYAQPFIVHKTLGNLDAPVMYQGGTWDFGITPSINKSMGAYDMSPTPKYYVDFRRATHFAWTNIGMTDRQAIVAYSIAFMDHYVKGEAAAPVLTETLRGVAALRYASELGSKTAGAAPTTAIK